MQIHEIPEFSALWQDLADQAKLPAGGWQADPVSRRDDAQRRRVVWRLTRAGQRLALKQVFRPLDPQAFAAEIGAHLAVQDRFDAVPQILAADVGAQVVLMQWAGSETLFDALAAAAPGDAQEILARAGGWVARFHASGMPERRIFQPKYSVRHLRRLMDEVQAGARPIARPEDWLACAEHLCARQKDYEGQETVAAQGHGDLNLRNILMGPPVQGLDFRPGGPVPVGHDLARLLVHYGAVLAPPARGKTLPGVDLAGFFEGYTLAGPDDPGIGFLTRMRILIDWQTLPADAATFTLAEARRFRGLRRLAQESFGL